MMLTFQRKNPTDVFIELGGGANPVTHPRCLGGPDVNVDVRACYTPEGHQTVDFTINFEEFPWPISDNDFDGLISHFCLEHVSYQNVPRFLSECLRIIKPGGRCVIVTANTEAQLRFIQGHPSGWDDKDDFYSFSEVLFGTQDYQANAHRAYFSPGILAKLLTQARFREVNVQPYGARGTDLLVEGVKSVMVPVKFVIDNSPNRFVLTDPTAAPVDPAELGLPPGPGDLVTEEVKSASLLPVLGNDHRVQDGLVIFNNPVVMASGAGWPPNELVGEEVQTESNPLVKSINEQFIGVEPGKEPFGTTLKLPTEAELRAETALLQKQRGLAEMRTKRMPEGPRVNESVNENKGAAELASGNLGWVSLTPAPEQPPPKNATESGFIAAGQIHAQGQQLPREQLFDKEYFNGGRKVGGYAMGPDGAYRDFEVHWHTFNHVMSRKPESVLELGAARGYILKRLQDAGVHAVGLEISKHCHMTQACKWIGRWDLCQTPWPIECRPLNHDGDVWPKEKPFVDLCFSIATLEHVPEDCLPAVIKEMARTCKRGLHGIDFGEHDDGFDKTHCSLFSKKKWEQLFAQHAPGWPVEILDKEELERGVVPQEVLTGDGKIKLEIGSFTTMTPWGWINIDLHDLGGWAGPRNYRYMQHDVRTGLPFQTGEVSLIHMNHVLEHFTYKEGLSLLRECRRVLKPDGALRLAVPDASLLCGLYAEPDHYSAPHNDYRKLEDFDEISDGAAAQPTPAGKLWELLFSGHQAAYDEETLSCILREAGFKPLPAAFRQCGDPHHSGLQQIKRECTDTHPCLSCYCDAVPMIG